MCCSTSCMPTCPSSLAALFVVQVTRQVHYYTSDGFSWLRLVSTDQAPVVSKRWFSWLLLVAVPYHFNTVFYRRRQGSRDVSRWHHLSSFPRNVCNTLTC